MKSGLIVLVLHLVLVIATPVHATSDFAKAADHLASMIFESVSRQLEEERPKRNLADSQFDELVEEVSTEIARCYISGLFVYGESVKLEAIRMLANGSPIQELHELMGQAARDSGDPGSVIAAMSAEQQSCIYLVNQQFGIEYE